MRAVDLLGYTPNSAAKNLRTQRSGKIAERSPAPAAEHPGAGAVRVLR
jgi:DNA-binding LacI/PurR family transcriptional regulator